MAKSKIEWTDKVWNPITGCTKISPGCQNCYAERMSKRLAGRCGYPAENPFKVTLHPNKLDEPLGWNKPCKIFVCSMGDLFHEDVPDEFIDQIFARFILGRQHKYLTLTKRPERMRDYINSREENVYQVVDDIVAHADFAYQVQWPLPNVWLGVTAENQEQANKRIPILLHIPAVVRFISIEPMLGPIKIPEVFLEKLDWGDGPEEWPDGAGVIDWVICGGETGPGARPMHPEWARAIRDQCQTAGVPFMFKQWGEYAPGIPNNGHEPYITDLNCVGVRGHQAITMDNGLVMERVGKKKAGRLLDGREWNEFPK